MNPNSVQVAIDGKRSSRQSRSKANDGSKGISYAIISQPRTGSSLLMELLRVRGLGTPDEYLHEDRIRVWWPKLAGPDAAFDLQRYIALLRQSQFASNGHFGIKIHYSHLREHFKERAVIQSFVAGFDGIIVVTRANKLSQAVSALKATQTGRWGAEAPEANVEPTFDPVAIAENLRRFLFQDRQIAGLNLGASRPALFVTYEDLRDSIGESWERIQNFLGVAPEPVPTTIRSRQQRNAQSLEFEERFLKLIKGQPVAD